MALISFVVYGLLLSQMTSARVSAAYRRLKGADLTYTFTEDSISWSMRGEHAEVAWDWLDRIVEEPDLFAFARGYWYLCVPRRDVPADKLADLEGLIAKHGPQLRA